jgi:hypothetical protein
MNTVRTALRRLFGATEDTESTIHFHRRGEEPEPCYEAGCTLPRLAV